MAQPEPVSSLDPSLEARWTEWIALGARRDRETARHLRIALPIMAACAFIGLYLFVR